MAVVPVTPATIVARTSAALAGDVLLMALDRYPSLPKVKANLTFRAADYEADPYKAVSDDRGFEGRGFGVTVTDFLNGLPPGTKLEGLFWDSSGRRGINGAHTVNDGIVVNGCACTDRPTDGSRRIGFTLGDVAGLCEGFEFNHSRWFRQGQRGDTHDHPTYFKNARAPRMRDSIFQDAGWFPLHLYPECDQGVFERLIIWGCGSAAAFSGGGNATTGVFGRSERNLLERSIVGAGHGAPGAQAEADGYLIEGFGGGQGNIVRHNVITRGGGRALLYKPGLVGVTYEGNIDVQPKWRGGDPLVTGDFRQAVDSPAREYGPLMTRPGWAPGAPPAPEPAPAPPPEPLPSPEPAPPPAPDTTGPALTWVRPAEGAVLAGAFRYTAEAVDPSGVSWVEFRLKDNSRGIDQLLMRELWAPYGETPFDTTLLPDGPYTLMATSHDHLGNASTITRQVTVRNGAPPPPPPPSGETVESLRAERDAALAKLAQVRADVAAETQRHTTAVAAALD